MLINIRRNNGIDKVFSHFSDFIGPSVGGVLLDTVGFELMTTFSAGLCLFMVQHVFIMRYIHIQPNRERRLLLNT